MFCNKNEEYNLRNQIWENWKILYFDFFYYLLLKRVKCHQKLEKKENFQTRQMLPNISKIN